MSIKIGTIVTVDTLGRDPHVVIGQATKGGWWLQNLITGALPTQTRHVKGGYFIRNGQDVVGGFMPREMREAGTDHVSWSQLDCHVAGSNHSTDTVTHYAGSTTPEHLCGYHATANTGWRK